MTYAKALAFLNGRINYELAGLPDAAELRLGRMRALLSRLGDPHRRYKVVHVAGTKGKGSTATMIAALLHATGASVGLHLSPHLERVEERLRVDGGDPSPNEFAMLIAEVASAAAIVDRERRAGEPGLTFFELTTAAAFLRFAQRGVDWSVIEVGVGGRLDATNVVDPAISVITEIGLDHTKTLGDTIAAIAAEKAGIIKPNRPVVTSATHPAAVAVIEEASARRGSLLKRSERDFRSIHEPHGFSGAHVVIETWKDRRSFNWRLLGAHQARNAALAWASFDVLAENFGLQPPPADALAELPIPGRLEVVAREPHLILLDVAHNEPSAAALADFLDAVAGGQHPRVLVFGATRDKNWQAMLERLVPRFDALVATEYLRSPRATPVGQLAEWLADCHPRTFVTREPIEAMATAHKLLGTNPGGIIVVAGSFFLAAEIRPFLLQTAARDRIE